jgi:UDP-GlcNAc3NAcA epimerase
MKIATIVGARPQFIKAAVVSRALLKYLTINEFIIHTGQHYDENMSAVFFSEMEIPKPLYNLNIHGLSHGAMTGQMLEGIEKILSTEKPDLVLVYGDTNSTLAGALAAKKLHIRVAHIEAGLRSFDLKMPEEINRILTDRISDFLFCPTEQSVKNLEAEGFRTFSSTLFKSGDVMYDASLFYAKKNQSKILDTIPFKQFVLCTIHREENTNDTEILKSLLSVIDTIHKEIPVLFPIHPRTQKILVKENLKTQAHLIPPVSYFDMLKLIQQASIVMTDSGGLQKEAFFFEKYCIALREQTEWTELVENGFNIVAGHSKEKIVSAFHTFLKKESDFKINLYGDGQAGEKIAERLFISGSK